MKKLSLHPDCLRVESFEASTTRGDRGTVWGHADDVLLSIYDQDTFAGPDCYRVTGDRACHAWTESGSTC